MRAGPWALCATVALAACTTPERAARDARDSVRRDLDLRLGTLPRDEPGVVSDLRVRALLADGVDEDEAVRIALLSNRAIVARYAELGVAAADLAQASLWANPILDVGFLFFDDGTEIDLGLSQSFVDVLMRSRRTATAEHEIDAARARVSRDVVAHAFATRRAHVNALAARDRFELETKHASATEASVGLMRRLHDAGNVTASSVALEESALAARLLDRSAAEIAALAAREALGREMGLWAESADWSLAGDLRAGPAAGVDLENVESRAIAASLDLAERRATMNVLAQAGGLARWDMLLSDASLGIGVSKDADGSEWGVGPHGSIGIPLGDVGSARQYGADARLAAAAADHWQHALHIRSTARTFRDRLRALDADARFSREVHVPAEQRVVRETLRNFNAMQIGPFDVLRAQGMELMAERRGVSLLADAWKARLDLEELLAGSANDARLTSDGYMSAPTTAPGAREDH